MDKEIFMRILSTISSLTDKQAKSVKFADKDYQPIEFSTANFHPIKSAPAKGTICFIDGGNSQLIGSSDFSLQFIRAAAILLVGNTRKGVHKEEFFSLATCSVKDELLNYEVKTFPEKFSDFLVDSMDENLRTGLERTKISRMGELVRSLAELKLAGDYVDKLSKDDIIVLDGTMQPKLPYEKEMYSLLFEKALKKGVTLCSLAKTSDMLTDAATSVASAIDKLSPQGVWYYSPVCKNNNPLHPAEISLVKLHPKSDYIFRFEILSKQQSQLPSVLEALSFNSADPLFLGYPYGLELAHESAKAASLEIQQLQTIFKSRMGKDWKQIERHLKATNAHDILDRI